MFRIQCQAILFDMDGTLVDSTHCVEAIWHRWAARHGLDPLHILAKSHGRRAADTLREIAPHLNIEQEVRELDAEELNYTEGIRELPGAAGLLRALPAERWAVVTSATHALAALRMQCAALPIPALLVGAEDVVEGKPNPAGYRLAASLLQVAPEDCLVIEDTPAGLAAGRSAGMQVLAITTTYSADELREPHWIRDFHQIRVVSGKDGMELHSI